MNYETKALVAYVFERPFGANKEGDIVQLNPSEAEALVDAGILAEATEEHVNAGAQTQTKTKPPKPRRTQP